MTREEFLTEVRKDVPTAIIREDDHGHGWGIGNGVEPYKAVSMMRREPTATDVPKIVKMLSETD